MLEIFLSWIRMYGFSRTAVCVSRFVAKYGETKPRSNCIPSTNSVVLSIVFDSSTVITPSLPTFSIAPAISLPISISLLAEMDATCAISSLSLMTLDCFLISSTASSTALSIPRFNPIGLMPAATLLRPSLIMLYASTVAVVVPSPAISFVLVATSLRS